MDKARLSQVPAVALDEANDPARAHEGLDEMLAGCTGKAVSALVIVYEPGVGPVMRYFGRTLSTTEIRGVLTSVLLGTVRG